MAKVNRLAELARETDENYLKAILLIHMKKGNVYASDLVEYIGNNTSSTYASLAKLVENGYIRPYKGNREAKASIQFTKAGDVLARKVLGKHQKIMKWLIQLGISEDEADSEACMMEHGLSENTMDIITRHVDMASHMLGEDSAYPEKMRMIAQRIRMAPSKPAAMTETEKIMLEVESRGGLAAIVENDGLIHRAGGREPLNEIINFYEVHGGYTGLKRLQKLVKKTPDDSTIADMLEFLSDMGGSAKLREEHSILCQLGGEEKVLQLLQLSSELGGIDTLLEVVKLGCQMKAVFKQSSKRKGTAENNKN